MPTKQLLKETKLLSVTDLLINTKTKSCLMYSILTMSKITGKDLQETIQSCLYPENKQNGEKQ